MIIIRDSNKAMKLIISHLTNVTYNLTNINKPISHNVKLRDDGLLMFVKLYVTLVR